MADDKDKRVVDLMEWLKADLSKKSDPQVLTDESQAMIREKFVWKDEFQDIMWAFHDNLRKHNYGMLHDLIHEMLDNYELQQPPES